jgi:primase-polymerase (primpol)-like protein
MTAVDQIPKALKQERQWVCWRTEPRDGKQTKAPIDPWTGRYASVSDPATWSDFATAYERYEHSVVDGLGFVFTADDPYAGVDIDDGRNPDTGTVEEWAVDVLLRLQSYTEVSPSGTGYHVIVEGTVPNSGNRNGNLEMYDCDRYFTITGDRVPGAPPTIEQRTDVLHNLHREYIAPNTAEHTSADTESTEVPVSDAELIEKAMNAANGDKFRVLWQGDTSGYPSHSEADQALCNLLAFWTGGDAHRIERLFEKSGLVRDKWRNRADYRERTIRTAIRDCPSYYDT